MVRKGFLVALAVVAMPASAGAQSLDEGECRSSVGSRSFCVGMAKVGERASAECRRAGIPEDGCWSRVGRRVLRREVDDYQQSWTHRTLLFQSELAGDVPFRNAPWLATHNSFNSTSEDPTLSHTDSNQQLSLTDQLRLDLRSLELDVHWTPSHRAGGASAPVVCHGQGNIGCTTERLLGERLPELTAWLAANPREVLLLYIEDGIGDAGYAATAKVVTDALGERLYRPRGGGCRNLPLDLTRNAVLAAGAQVVVVGDCGSGAWQSVSHAWPDAVRFEERNHGFQPYPDCGPPDAAESDAKLVRYYEDSTWLTATAGGPDDGIGPDTVRAMLDCGVDLIGFDQILPRDGRLDAAVWSWADGQPSADEGCTVQGGEDGRWRSESCRRKHRAACRSAAGDWTVPARRVKRSSAAALCSDAGLQLGTPRTAHENRLLEDRGAGTVWLGL